MGSGSTRKTKDKPTIGLRSKGSGSGNSGGSSNSSDTTCLSSFQVKVNAGIPLKKGQVVVLRKNAEGIYDVYAGTKLIAALNKKTSEMVSTCSAMKVHYSGEIIEEKNGLFARFIRQ